MKALGCKRKREMTEANTSSWSLDFNISLPARDEDDPLFIEKIKQRKD